MDQEEWIKNEINRQERILDELRGELRAEIQRLRDQLDHEVKPLRRVVDMAIGGWTLLVLAIGVAVALVKNAFSGGH